MAEPWVPPASLAESELATATLLENEARPATKPNWWRRFLAAWLIISVLLFIHGAWRPIDEKPLSTFFFGDIGLMFFPVAILLKRFKPEKDLAVLLVMEGGWLLGGLLAFALLSAVCLVRFGSVWR